MGGSDGDLRVGLVVDGAEIKWPRAIDGGRTIVVMVRSGD